MGSTNLSARAMAPRIVNSQPQSRLFTLPAEIRNHIYTLVLTVPTHDEAIWSPQYSTPPILLIPYPNDPNKPTVLSLLATCRLVHDEAYGIFYSMQSLELDHHTMPSTRLLSKQRLAAFREVTTTAYEPEELNTLLRKLRHFPQLKIVTINLHLDSLTHLQHLEREGYFLKSPAPSSPNPLSIFTSPSSDE